MIFEEDNTPDFTRLMREFPTLRSPSIFAIPAMLWDVARYFGGNTWEAVRIYHAFVAEIMDLIR